MSSETTRREFFARTAPALALAVPAVAAAAPGAAPDPDPELYEAAREFKAALDRAVSLDCEASRRWSAVRAGRLDEAEYAAWSEAEGVQEAGDAVEATQRRLFRVLGERDLNAVIIDGTLFLGPWDDRYQPIRSWPDRFAIAEMSRVANLDAGGPAR